MLDRRRWYGPKIVARGPRPLQKQKAAFSAQKRNAKQRGIPFLFTFQEWWAWWQIDNRWESRGMGSDKFVMARHGDKGPYSPENVYCATHAQNIGSINAQENSARIKAAWARGVDFKLPKGADNPRSMAIQTPDGVFANATLAAEHFGLSRAGAAYRARHRVKGWSWAKITETK